MATIVSYLYNFCQSFNFFRIDPELTEWVNSIASTILSLALALLFALPGIVPDSEHPAER